MNELNALVKRLFELYPIFCCIKDTYEKFHNKEEVKKYCLLLNQPVPQLITDVYTTSCSIIKIIDVSLQVFPLGTSKFSIEMISSIMKKAYWDKSSNNQVASELCISEGALTRFLKNGKKIIYTNIYDFLQCQFAIYNINTATDNKNKTQTLIDLTKSQETFGNCDKLKKAANTVYNKYFYNSFLNTYFKELKRVTPYGRYYSTITKIIIEHPEYEIKKLLKNKYKYFSEKYTYRKVKTFVKESTEALGILLFGINYIAVDYGLFFEKSNDSNIC